MPGCVQGAAALPGLDNHDPCAKRRQEPVLRAASDERTGGITGRALTDQNALGGDRRIQAGVRTAVPAGQPVGHDRDGEPVGGERAAVSLGLSPGGCASLPQQTPSLSDRTPGQ